MRFILSKVLWAFLSPGNALVLLLLLGAFFAVAQSEVLRRWGRRLCFVIAFFLFVLGILPIGDWMLSPLENRFPLQKPDHVDGILLVGEDENADLTEARGQPIGHLSASDHILFASLAREYPKAKLVFTGGSGALTPNQNVKNSDISRQMMSNLGIPLDHVVFESVSRNTYENAAKTAAIIHPTPQQNWILVTSALHMPRTMACFRKAGWNVFPAPANYMTDGTYAFHLRLNVASRLLQLDLAMHEYVGLVMYRLMGYTDYLWP